MLSLALAERVPLEVLVQLSVLSPMKTPTGRRL